MEQAASDDTETEALRRRVRELEQRQSAADAALKTLTAERDNLRRVYQMLRLELDLLRRRIYAAKAERLDTAQLDLEFAEKRAQLLAVLPPVAPEEESTPPANAAGKKKKASPGRRDLSLANLPEVRCELPDATMVAQGLEPIGFEESRQLGYQRGGPVCIVIARAKYKVSEADGSIHTAPLPRSIVPRALCAPSMMAKILVDKFCDGMPFFRQVEQLSRIGVAIDRGMMSRIAEEVGLTLGCIVLAARDEAMRSSFCLATDATGVAIQPTRLEDGKRQACRKGHFFVTLADRDHVFFSFEPKHTSDAVCALFKGYTGYIQADAHAVYDALFRGRDAGEDEPPDKPTEVGCFAHARRKFYDAAVTTHDPRAREALFRIRLLFEKEAEWAKLAPEQRGVQRRAVLGPWLADFFRWAEEVYAVVGVARGPLAAAFGYVVRQQEPLSRFLDDGRLRIDNNASERALRQVAVGRKAWLFFGSDDHAEAAANLMGLLASCKLHRVEPMAYLEAVIRLVPVWPRDRYLELAPKYWAETRGRLDADQLAAAVGPIAVPPPNE